MVAAALAQDARAPNPSAPATAPTTAEDPLGRSTPRGTVMGFIKATEHQNYVLAAEYLDTKKSPAQAQELARELQIILNLGLSADVDKLSRKPEGDLEDGLRPIRDRVGTVKSESGELDIWLDRVSRANQSPIWLFSSDTLRGVPDVFEEMHPLDVEKYVPSSLVKIKFLSIPLLRWFAVLLALIVALALASLVTRFLIPLLRPLVRRMTHQEDDRLVGSLRAPLRLILFAIPIQVVSVQMGVTLLARLFWARVATTIAVAGLAWLLIRFSDIVSELGERRLRDRQKSGKIAALALTRRVFKGAVIVAAVLTLVYSAGMDVVAILTGLGVGGVAIAFAAQKTLENLFGGVSIITDEPIRVGDLCQVANQAGTVVDIGLRSTRIRTAARTILSIPNGLLATMSLENFTSRDKTLFQHTIALRRETSADVLRQVLAKIHGMLQAHPDVEPQSARVRFIGFANSAVNVEIFCYVMATQPPAFLGIQEDLLLRIMDTITATGSGIALPAQTIYVVGEKLQSNQIPDANAKGARSVNTQQILQTGQHSK
jgi:MscS family membrane protein